jgi:hypothetical protein
VSGASEDAARCEAAWSYNSTLGIAFALRQDFPELPKTAAAVERFEKLRADRIARGLRTFRGPRTWWHPEPPFQSF